MKRILVLIIGLILLAWLIYHCLHSRPPVIEEHVLACVSEKLAGDDFADVQVAVDGRDVALSGYVADDTLSQQEEQKLEQKLKLLKVSLE